MRKSMHAWMLAGCLGWLPFGSMLAQAEEHAVLVVPAKSTGKSVKMSQTPTKLIKVSGNAELPSGMVLSSPTIVPTPHMLPTQTMNHGMIVPGPMAAADCEACGDGSWDGMMYDTSMLDAGNAGLSFYGEVGLLYLRREESNPNYLASIIGNPNTLSAQIDSSELDFAYEPGLKASIGFLFSDSMALEAGYWGLHYFQDDTAYNSIANQRTLFSPYAINVLPGFINSGLPGSSLRSLSVAADSEVHSAELNLRRFLSQGENGSISALVGFRYFYLEDRLDLVGIAQDFSGADLGQTTTETMNHLFGLQIGVDVQRKLGAFGVYLGGRSGTFYNNLDQDTRNTQLNFDGFNNSTVVSSLTATASTNTLAFFVEGIAGGEFWLNDNLGVRGGYQFTLISGVGAASEQLQSLGVDVFSGQIQPTTGATVYDDGQIILHGPFVSLIAQY